MKDKPYKFGVYLDKWSVRYQMLGFGVVWTSEKYIHFNLFNFEIAIGVTAR
jgi:hypothetical protein